MQIKPRDTYKRATYHSETKIEVQGILKSLQHLITIDASNQTRDQNIPGSSTIQIVIHTSFLKVSKKLGRAL